jgi:hypothetical protein
MKSYLTAAHLGRLRQHITCVVYAVLPVQALVGVVTSYVGPDDVVHGWLRDHGPIAFFGDHHTIVFDCRGAFSVGYGRSLQYRVTADCEIMVDGVMLSLWDGPAARCSMYDLTDGSGDTCGCQIINFTCTRIPSINGKAVLIGAEYSSPCTAHGESNGIVVSYDPSDEETRVARIYNMDLSTDHITKDLPSNLDEFVNMLTTFAIPDGVERGWTGWSHGLTEGIIRFGSGSDSRPHLYRTETSAAGCMVQRTDIISDKAVRMLQPMLSFIRPRNLGIKVVEGRDCWMYTLVDAQTEYIAPVIRRGRRRRTKTVRFSPL